MATYKTVKLNNGILMPAIAHGSWAPPDPVSQAGVKDWILTALQSGFRHIDTAQSYGTEKAVGDAILSSGIPREDIFVTTKLPWNCHHRVQESFEKSLKDLGTGYIDLYLVHWPQAIAYEENNDFPMNPNGTLKTTDTITFQQSWAELEKLYEAGKVRAIGVSNFSVKTLEELLKTAKIVPALNQVELHPFLAQNGLREYCAKKGITVSAYSSSGYSFVRNDPLVVQLAEKYQVTPTQVVFAWHTSRNTVITCKSTKSDRQKENLFIPEIAPEDLEKIWTLDHGRRLACNVDPKTNQCFGWTAEQLGWEDFRPKPQTQEIGAAPTDWEARLKEI